MNAIEERDVECPYCAETINVLLDLTAGDQDYIEDCQVCCQPIEFAVRIEGESATVNLRQADE